MNRPFSKRLTLFILAAFLALAPGLCAMGAATGEKNMTDSRDIANTVLSIPEDRFFEDIEPMSTDMEINLAETDFFGVAINAPRAISIDEKAQVPVIMAIRQNGTRGWEVPEGPNCVLVATELNSRKVYFGQVFRDPKAEIYSMPVDAPPPPRPDGVSAIAIMSRVSGFDAATVAPLPWEPGVYRLFVTLFDWRSNPADVELIGGDAQGVFKAPPVDPQPAGPGEDKTVPTFLLSADPAFDRKTPPAVDFTVETGADGGVRAQGRFSFFAEAFHIPEKPYTLREVDGEEKTVGANVPLTLAVFGLNGGNPIRFDWSLPVYSRGLLKEGDRAAGSFAVDLADPRPALQAGKYAAYVIFEGRLAGPARFSVGD